MKLACASLAIVAPWLYFTARPSGLAVTAVVAIGLAAVFCFDQAQALEQRARIACRTCADTFVDHGCCTTVAAA